MDSLLPSIASPLVATSGRNDQMEPPVEYQHDVAGHQRGKGAGLFGLLYCRCKDPGVLL